MPTPRNWTTVGIGLEVLAGVLVAVEPLLAIPVAIGGGVAILWGLYPDRMRHAMSSLAKKDFSNVFTSRNDTVAVLQESSRIADGLESLTDRGRVLLSSSHDDKLKYSQDVVHWVNEAETFLSAHLPGDESYGFRTINLVPAVGSDPDVMRNVLQQRVGKLRLITMRYLRQVADKEPQSTGHASRKQRAKRIGALYAQGVALRNRAASLQTLDAAIEAEMDELQEELVEQMRDLAPERSINLDTLNLYDPREHLAMALQNPKRTLEFSEFLRRIMKILEDYK